MRGVSALAPDPIIRVRELGKLYRTQKGDGVSALSNITFDVADGEFITCVGPSGCGKTTLLKILAGLLPRDSGEALLRGSSIEGPRRDIGVVFQTSVLLPWRTVLDNTLLPAQVLGLDRERSRERAQALIRLAGLEGFEDKYPFELSGGMQQRNSIIRALIHDPAILLMDEPFGALDAMTREQMNLDLMRIWQRSGKTIVLITHSIAEAVLLGDRVVVMSPRPGRIVDMIDIDLPRPRDFEMVATPEFGNYSKRIREHLFARSAVD
jgi:NitT/TauT family transport system ATP-binding protein